ncbi:DUF1540 domain-containing protein [Propioniciclava soli]|uniref:DUF1540 domain-containing protein n=1 Tax=Propioniciclava soli TaxID=2775081 RepID=A0ABZ3C7M9_9ACTN
MSTVTAIKSCAMMECAFNSDGCTAYAITVGGQKDASCVTFVTLDARGGLGTADAHVGACQRLECVHNADLMCTADSIGVSADANCAQYEVR